MSSAKALYFIAIGVLALGLSHDYREGRLPWAHRYLDRPLAVAQEYSACLKNYIVSELMPGNALTDVEDAGLDHDRVLLGRDQVLMSRDQVRTMVEQARLARAEVARHRGEIERAQRIVVDRVDGIRVVCPHTGKFVVNVPGVNVQSPNIVVDIPEVVNMDDAQ